MKRITAFGEILFDVYPEFKTLGGASFNFIFHINKITGGGNLISKIGDDEPGREIKGFLKSNNISTGYLEVDNGHPTGVANANLDEMKIPHWEIKHNCAYDFIESSNKITKLVENLTDCLYFGTLAQRSRVSKNTLNSLFGRQIKYFCDLNLRQEYYNKEVITNSLKTADVLKLNNDELKVVNQMFFKLPYKENNLAEKISDEFNIELVCITLGDNGAILFKNGQADYYKEYAPNVIDTVGAGDAYASILCLGYLNGWDISEINKIASRFAAEIVQIKGALPAGEDIYNKLKYYVKNG